MTWAVKTKLRLHVTTHLDVAKNLLRGETERSEAGAGSPWPPSRFD